MKFKNISEKSICWQNSWSYSSYKCKRRHFGLTKPLKYPWRRARQNATEGKFFSADQKKYSSIFFLVYFLTTKIHHHAHQTPKSNDYRTKSYNFANKLWSTNLKSPPLKKHITELIESSSKCKQKYSYRIRYKLQELFILFNL